MIASSAMELAAHSVLLNGWAVFPLKPRDKVPLTAHGCLDASRCHEQVTSWWTRWPDANLGIATGNASGVLVVDVDGADGDAALEEYGTLGATVEARTGKGRHLYFALPDGVRLGNSARRLGPRHAHRLTDFSAELKRRRARTVRLGRRRHADHRQELPAQRAEDPPPASHICRR